MKRYLLLLFVLCGSVFSSFSQNCNENESPFLLIMVAKENIEINLIEKYPSFASLYETYKIEEINSDKATYHLAGCGDAEQAKIDFENPDIFEEIIAESGARGPDSINPLSRSQIIFSNPVKDKLSLTLPNAENEIKIFDLQGKLLLQQNVGFSAEINVSMLPAGTYVLVVNNSERLTFIKQ